MHAVIADEWSVLRHGVVAVLDGCNVRVVEETASATSALAALATVTAGVLIIGQVADQRLLDVVRQAKQLDADIKVVVLAPNVDRADVVELLDEGADAVVTRTASEVELRDAVERVQRGERFLAPGLLAALFGANALNEVANDDGLLTSQERRVLALLVEGMPNRQIGRTLYIAEATVKTHLNHVYRKLGVANRVEAMNRAFELRLVH